MSYRTQLINEINTVLDRLRDEKRIWNASLITQSICEEHSDELQGEAHFSRYNIYNNVRKEVRETINKRAGDRPTERNPQLTLPGFEYVQEYYMVNRNGDDVGVSAYDLTDQEIEEKVALYRKMGDSCHAHADDLTRFKDRRNMI